MNTDQRMELAGRLMRAASEVMAAVARANVRVAAMNAANAERIARGQALAYPEPSFLAVIDEEGIDHNAVIHTLSV